jgi:DNA-binding IclR family transcriptional regulator
MIVIDYLDSQNIIKASLATGTHAPLVSTSTGKATLAALTIEERKKLLANYYPDFLDSKGNPKNSLENELKIISKQKYAVSEG